MPNMKSKKLKMLIEYLKRKLKRRKDEMQTIEDKINGGVASNLDKQKFAELKGRIEELEDDIDAAELMVDITEKSV